MILLHSHLLFGVVVGVFFFLMIRRPPRSTQSRSSAASDVYKRQAPYSETIRGPVASETCKRVHGGAGP